MRSTNFCPMIQTNFNFWYKLIKRILRLQTSTFFPANSYLFIVNNRNTINRCKICSKLTIKAPERQKENAVHFNNCGQFKCSKVLNASIFKSFLCLKSISKVIHLTAAHKGWQRLLSTYVCMWTESQKICKVWAIINQVFPWCLPSHWLWLTRQIVESVDISESIDINQSISINQLYLIEASNFIRDFFCFPIIYNNSILSTHARRVYYLNKWKA